MAPMAKAPPKSLRITHGLMRVSCSAEVPVVGSHHSPWVASMVSVGHDQELTSADEQRAWNVLQLSENLGAGSGPAKKNEHVTSERGII